MSDLIYRLMVLVSIAAVGLLACFFSYRVGYKEADDHSYGVWLEFCRQRSALDAVEYFHPVTYNTMVTFRGPVVFLGGVQYGCEQ